MHALSRERERSRAETGRASTGELRFRSNRCALLAACVRSPCPVPRVCVHTYVCRPTRAPSPCIRLRYMERIMSQHPSEHRGTTVSPPSPWNVSFSLLFLSFFFPFFNLPPPPPPPPRLLVSSYIEPSDSRLIGFRDASRKERVQLKHNESGRNILGIF